MKTKTGSKFEVLVTSLSAVVLSGCASMFNPYLDLGDRPEVVNVESAVGYANDAIDVYRTALGDQAKFKAWLGAGLIPLAAATTGLGIQAVSQEAITALALTGATGLGLGAWFENTPRQRAYIAGYNAINCAVDATVPFKVKGSSQFTDYETALSAINGKIEAVQTNIANVRLQIANVGLTTSVSPLVVQAEESVTTAETVLANAKSARRNGVALQREIDIAGDRLITSVDRIAGQVDLAVLQNQPDIQTLASIISGLGSAYSKFTAIPKGAKGAEDVAAPAAAGDERSVSQQLANALRQLQTSVAQMGTDER